LWQYTPISTNLKPKDREIERLQKLGYEEITDIDIQVNDGKVLKFVKLPWASWIYGTVFALSSALLFYLVCESYITNLWLV